MDGPPSPWITLLISVSSAILATLLTIIVTPTLQHHFWRLQRRAELRLVTINEVNRVTSEFVAKYLTGGVQGKPHEDITEFLQSFHATNSQVRALFSIDTALAYSRLMEMIRPTFGRELREGRVSIPEFIEIRNAALRAMYEEVGVIPRDKDMTRIFEQLISQHKAARLERSGRPDTDPQSPQDPT